MYESSAYVTTLFQYGCDLFKVNRKGENCGGKLEKLVSPRLKAATSSFACQTNKKKFTVFVLQRAKDSKRRDLWLHLLHLQTKRWTVQPGNQYVCICGKHIRGWFIIFIGHWCVAYLNICMCVSVSVYVCVGPLYVMGDEDGIITLTLC